MMNWREMGRRTSRTVVVLAVAVVAVVGCATASRQAWTKPGAGPEDLGRDRYACIQESSVPWGMSFGSLSASPESAHAGWGSGASVAQGGSSGGFVFLGRERNAQSQANRLFDACMEARGWR